ncbi:hypothetical protein [Streptomyces niveus]|uniref:hypothetical protein n=1 Tax=Streptomyces niveus TaxID=193462 RepID=UPI003662D0E9
MTSSLTSKNLIRLFGLGGIIYFPDYPDNPLNASTASFLSSTGLPHDRIFTSTHLDLNLDESNPVTLGPRHRILRLLSRRIPKAP